MLKNLLKVTMLGAMLVANAINADGNIDLQDLTLKNVNQPYSQVITGGQPSITDLTRLKKIGVVNIVNLRTKGEFDGFDEAEEVKKLGLNYVSLEIAGASGITLENGKKLDALLSNVKGKTLVHCASSNRVGALFAVIAHLIKKKPIDKAMIEGKSAGMKSLTEKTRKLLVESSK